MRILLLLLSLLTPASLLATRLPLAPGEVYQLDADRSQILIRVYRAGWGAVLGHNHLLSVQGLSGTIEGDASKGARADLAFSVADILLDDPTLRAAAGAEFKSKPSAEDIAATQKNMLGADALGARRYPLVKISVLAVRCPGNSCVAEVDIDVRGVKNRYSVALQIDEQDGTFQVKGRLDIYQSSFNMQPFSVLGGALRVADRLDVEFRLFALHRLPKDTYE